MGFGGGGEQKSKESPPRSLFHGQDFQLAKRGYSFPPDGRRFLLSSSVRVCVCVWRYSRSSASSPSISKAAYLLAELNFCNQNKAQGAGTGALAGTGGGFASLSRDRTGVYSAVQFFNSSGGRGLFIQSGLEGVSGTSKTERSLHT